MENKTLLAVFDLDGTVLDTLDDLADSVKTKWKSKGIFEIYKTEPLPIIISHIYKI